MTKEGQIENVHVEYIWKNRIFLALCRQTNSPIHPDQKLKQNYKINSISLWTFWCVRFWVNRLKMNKSLMGLERHEKWPNFNFWVNNPFKTHCNKKINININFINMFFWFFRSNIGKYYIFKRTTKTTPHTCMKQARGGANILSESMRECRLWFLDWALEGARACATLRQKHMDESHREDTPPAEPLLAAY